ncbi:MAG: hypothetical protein ACK48W_06345 [Bacteroidota bacterium]|jgi:uncharacterized protein involved in tolerance to divalent cations
MILLHIHANSMEQADKIAHSLLEAKLVYKIYQLENYFEFNSKYIHAKIEKCVILQAPTKSLLFTEIEKLIEGICGDDVPLFYGVPITNFCNSHNDKILTATEKS